MNIEQLFQSLKKNSQYWRTAPLSERKEGLRKLAIAIESHQAEICAAMAEDFGKPELEVLTTEIYPTLQEIRYALKHLDKWAKPQKVPAPALLLGTKNSLYFEPKGTVLVIAPWNYPFNLAMIPVVTALAAGNCVILKPSEMTPKTSTLMQEMLSDIFPENQVLTVQGGKEISQQLLQLPFDHIFFTGSTAVGKIVMNAASSHLSDVTLELGGKSPTIIDETANLKTAAKKIIWGKFVNAGQTCIAPDYLLVHADIYPEFLQHLREQVEQLYQNQNQDLARVINSQHMQRLSQLFNESLAEGATLVSGGQFDFKKNTLSPTLVENVPPTTKLMSEEIFGPLLPILKYDDTSDAIDFIMQRPKPLALYLFCNSKETTETILQATTAGGVCVNDTLLHFANHHMPFGGVGESGLGNYHGYYGFKTFSHTKAVLKRTWFGKMMAVIYPPYKPWKLKIAKFLIRSGI